MAQNSAPGARGGAALDTRGTSNTPPPRDASDGAKSRREGRAEREALKRVQRSISVLHAARLCMLAGADSPHVRVTVGASLIAHTTEHHRCGSPWACPVCGPTIRAQRADEVNEAVTVALGAGATVLFPTWTVPHRRSDGLADRFAYVAEIGNKIRMGKPWERRRDRFGYFGSISAPEVTWGERNGWHPHAHQLWCFEASMDADEIAEFGAWAFGRHAARCESAGFGTPDVDAFKLLPVTTPEVLSDYLVKLEKPWTIGSELTRLDRKKARHLSLGPFDLLRWLVETGEVRPLRLWNEFERATKGRAAVKFSAGLRGRLLGAEVGSTDEQLASVDAFDFQLLEVLVDNASWNRLVGGGRRSAFLDDVEDVAAFLLLTADLLGHHLQPLDSEVLAHGKKA